MKKLSTRIAALAPSITAALILFAVGLTALLAYRAVDASRAQQQMTERTLREYAGFAAYQLRNAAGFRMIPQYRGAFELVVRSIGASGPTPPLGAERAADMIRARGQVCRCLEGVSFYYQVTFADSTIDATASELATAGNLQMIRDTVLAQALAPRPPEPPLSNPGAPRPPGVPFTAQLLTGILSELNGHPYLLAQALTVDSAGRPLVAYGFAVPAELPVGRVVQAVLESQPILPNTLTRGMRMDSILDVTVRMPSGKVLFATGTGIDTSYAAADSLEGRLGGLRFEVAIDPAAAGILILGGLPRSRLPEVIATACVAVALLGMLLYMFRRQEELARLRDDFVSGVSHELRTPLAQIRLLAELLHMGKVPAGERQRSLRIIDKEARRLSFLVDSILSYTHSRRGRVSPVSTDIAGEIGEIVSGFAPLADAHGVRLVTRLEPGIVASVDRSALRQVLLNLLDNAVRYGPAGQDVTVTTRAEGDTWTLEVADEGPGIPADERERIFAPYYRMARDSGGAVGGTGIGLAVVRRLVEEHRGRVHVASSNGDGAGGAGPGARFVVALPMEVAGVNGR
ncbi:MAG TPA: HAMP domain-containing sensor histidine kinase [Gemmatimonadales bacterium]